MVEGWGHWSPRRTQRPASGLPSQSPSPLSSPSLRAPMAPQGKFLRRSSHLTHVQGDPELGSEGLALTRGPRNGPGWSQGAGVGSLGPSRAEIVLSSSLGLHVDGYNDLDGERTGTFGEQGELPLVWGEDEMCWPWLPFGVHWPGLRKRTCVTALSSGPLVWPGRLSRLLRGAFCTRVSAVR